MEIIVKRRGVEIARLDSMQPVPQHIADECYVRGADLEHVEKRGYTYWYCSGLVELVPAVDRK
jgi:hypothetical protein